MYQTHRSSTSAPYELVNKKRNPEFKQPSEPPETKKPTPASGGDEAGVMTAQPSEVTGLVRNFAHALLANVIRRHERHTTVDGSTSMQQFFCVMHRQAAGCTRAQSLVAHAACVKQRRHECSLKTKTWTLMSRMLVLIERGDVTDLWLGPWGSARAMSQISFLITTNSCMLTTLARVDQAACRKPFCSHTGQQVHSYRNASRIHSSQEPQNAFF